MDWQQLYWTVKPYKTYYKQNISFTMSKYSHEIINLIKNSKFGEAPPNHALKYLGTTHLYYCLGTQQKRKIAKDWKKSHHDISLSEYTHLIDDLYKGESYEEKTIASELLNLYPQHRKELNLEKIYEWLKYLEGWAEIDSLCQGSFPAIEILNRWEDWERMLVRLNGDQSIKRRRASLVLLCKSARESHDSKISHLAFRNITNTMHESEILITKAVSWLLRSLIKHHGAEVASFIERNTNHLPKIALRETKRKLKTGRK